MVDQMMATTHLLVTSDAFGLGVRCGADPTTLREVIKKSSIYSHMMDFRPERFPFAGTFQPGLKLDKVKEDMNLALDSSRAQGVPLLLTSAVAQIFSGARTEKATRISTRWHSSWHPWRKGT